MRELTSNRSEVPKTYLLTMSLIEMVGKSPEIKFFLEILKTSCLD